MSGTCPVCGANIPEAGAACPACGFKLLGPTESFKPVTLGNDEVQAAKGSASSAVLTVVRGPQTGITYELSGDSVSIGRNPQCALFLNDMTVSRLHATIYPREGRYAIVDENSFNGVWVNNQNVTSKVLEDGDMVQIGTFCLVYQDN